jgi:glycosyltransferase involved in cell wall biosynthesis
MVRIFDCSNSIARPISRGYGGPIINEFVGLLHKYATDFGCIFVNDLSIADVVFTNDIFPDYVKVGLPLIKRMDGVFWLNALKNRNKPYIDAALLSTHVIFSSNFSRESFKTLYPIEYKQISSSVCHHWVDSLHMAKINMHDPSTFVAIATDWSREEKRLSEIIRIANYVKTIHLIGKCDRPLPKNIIAHGYKASLSDIYQIMESCGGMLNLSYNDPSPKVVCTALNYGLPVLYANSGGVSEYVGNCGVGTHDNQSTEFQSAIPHLSDIESGIDSYMTQYDVIKNNTVNINSQQRLISSIIGYLDLIRCMI